MFWLERMMSRAQIISQVEASFGFVPGWLGQMPDEILAQFWTTLGWVLNDTALTAREKALVAFGAAAACRCDYLVPFHTAQTTLLGLQDDQLKEAGWVANSVSGASTFLYAIGYSKTQFQRELGAVVAHSQAGSWPLARSAPPE